MKIGILMTALTLAAGCAFAAPASAPAELLEKGIYVQETVGDLDKAISIYQQIMQDAEAARPYVAEAGYRLGVCLMKQDKSEQAVLLFQRLIERYPDQKKIVAQAREALTASRRNLGEEEVGKIMKGMVETISTCTESDPRVAKSLGEIAGLDNERAIKALLPYLEEKSDTMRRAAVFILWRGDFEDVSTAVPALKKLCSHEEDFTRGMAALTLGGRKVEAEFETLADMAVNDKSGYARRCGAYALGLLGNPEAVPLLERALKDTDRMVANNAQAALTMLRKAAQADVRPPQVIRTIPAAFATDVSPALDRLTVTFDQPMRDKSWSWTGGGETYPEGRGNPSYDTDRTTCTLLVTLEPGHVYWVGINSASHKNFQTPDGVPAGRYVILFSTATADGKPTPIPEDLLQRARQINGVEVASTETPAKDNDLQVLIDAARPGSIVNVPKGVFTHPLRIDKPLTLKGQGADSVIEVTSDQAALLVTSSKPVVIEGLTINWQRETSSRQADPPCALVVRDGKATVRSCSFGAPGGNTRCPCAVLAMGFSEVNIERCRFEGYEFTVQFGNGAKGLVEECLVKNPGHCGITVGPDSEVTIKRNIVTGSAFHALRCTGGVLYVEDNLIINNKNRGLYLGNKSAKGKVHNNIISGNGTGISGFANSEVEVTNNVILGSDYAAIDFRDTCRLDVKGNILQGNTRGIMLHSETGKAYTKVGQNTFWKNQADAENTDLPNNALQMDPLFKAPGEGDFTVSQAKVKAAGQGLENPAVFDALWKGWKAVEGK